ncbi:MAG TPA: ABC transporter permease [Gemmatimonadaceae bacterium]|nr:ABC transporter permease [Gemmatimonadaceae bacterium]
MHTLLQDLRHALRLLRRNIGSTVAVVVMLALAIGATTTIFGVVDAVIVRPLPFAAPEQLVQIRMTNPEGSDFTTSEPDFLDFAARNRSFSSIGAFRPVELTLTGVGDARTLRAFATSHELFKMLGIAPLAGRLLRADDDVPGEDADVVILSHALWVTAFAGDTAFIGESIRLNGRPHTVVGVLPANVRLPEGEVFVPLHASAQSERDDHWLELVGRLRPGVALAAAQADLAGIAATIAETYPMSRGWGVRIEPLTASLVDVNVRRAGWVMVAATGLLLLLACANVANLLLARATGRETELGVRVAMGAARGKLVRLMLTEVGLLVAIATGLGVLVALWGVAAVTSIGSGHVPRLHEVSIDARVLAITVALSVITMLVCGLIPALRASSVDPASVLGDGARAGVSRTHRRVREALVVLQVGISTVLLIGAGLMLRSVDRLASVDTGIDAERVLAVNLSFPSDRYDEAARVIFLNRVERRAIALPGAVAAGATAVDPFTGWDYRNDVTPERLANTTSGGFMSAAWRSVTPGSFAAMGIPIIRGRVFDGSDAWNGPRVAVVTQRLAQRLWPDDDAVGQRVYWGGTDGTPWTVVGVVGDIRDVAVETEESPTLFLPYNQVPLPGMTLLVRTSGDPASLAGALRALIHELDPLLPVDDIHPLQRNRLDAIAGPRFNLALLGSFAVLAALLASLGLYAVIAFAVARRQREIGVRLALGAEPATIVTAFVRSGIRIVLAGIATGLIIAWIATRWMRALLFDVTTIDTLVFTAVPVALAIVAVAASYVAARRAAGVMPAEALRSD